MALIDDHDLAEIDVLSNRVYSEGVPHAHLAKLRAERPIHFQHVPDERLLPQAWVLTKHEDVLAISKDTDRFVNAHGLNLRASYSDEEDRHLLNLDDPEHLRLRRMTNKNFTPRVVRRYTDHYHDMVGRLLDDAIERGRTGAGSTSIEVVDDVSVPMPLLAICELLGTTPDDREQLVRWSNAIITNDDPDYSPSEEYRTQAGLEMAAYAAEMLAERQANPTDDLASVLADRLDQGDLSPEEYIGYVLLLFVAGNETTRNNISHGLLQLAKNPDQYEILKTGDHWDTAVEEITRWASPVIYMSRTAVADVEYKGNVFRKGDRVVLHYASANRDEEVFDDPMRFDITRDPNPHLAFGFGTHFCLGAHLARLETRCTLEQLVARAESLQLGQAESYVWSSFISGIKRLDLDLALR
ncbi:MAG: cytochrome P450 [Actinomycetota bacterium]